VDGVESLTRVVHGLAEAFLALLEHVRVNVDNVDGKIAVRLAFAGMVEDAECNIASTPGNVDAASDLADSGTSWVERGNKRILPETMNAHRHGIIHKVVF